MRSTPGLVLFVVLLLLATLAGEAQAWEGRVQIGGGTPYVIVNPGHYILTSNMTLSSGPAIIVDSDCVEVNLNGKSILHNGNVAGDNLIEIASNRTDVTIHNGWLTGGHRGINFTGLGGDSTRVRIRDVEIRGAADRGISISPAESVELESNQIHEILGPYGIYVGAAPSSTFTGRFVENTVQEVAGWGIYAQGFEGGDVIGNVVRRFDTASFFAGHGIVLDGVSVSGGNVIEANTISLGGGDGLVISNDSRNNRIEGNVIYENSGVGLVLISSQGNKVKNNTIGNNGADGILVGSLSARNMIDANDIDSNVGWGIRFVVGASDNVCRDNTVQNNFGPSPVSSGQLILGSNSPVTLCQ